MNSESSSEIQDLVAQVSQVVGKLAGITLGSKQFSMIENRVKSRMMRLGIETPNDYLSYLRSNLEDESKVLLSLITTHHTYFFREFFHFEYIEEKMLDHLIQVARKRNPAKIRIWSAASSRGQEVYSLAMFFDYLLKKKAPDVSFEILGTDVDPDSVAKAQNGVYLRKDINEIPLIYSSNHISHGTGDISRFSKIKSQIKSKCKFETLNLLEPEKYPNGTFDIIFCRNVFLYFEKKKIESVTRSLFKKLEPHGCFFIGISESLFGSDLNIKVVSPSIYAYKDNSAFAQETKVAEIERKLRIVVIDDSKSVVSLMRQVLSSDHGFEIVGTASNGAEGAKVVAEKKPDAVTLDLHMPELDGFGYLRQHFKMGHPPVVIVSAIDRDDKDTIEQVLKLGAYDYVEKPTLGNLQNIGDQIRSKIRLSCKDRTKDTIPSQPSDKLSGKPTEVLQKDSSRKDSLSKDSIGVLIVDDSPTIQKLLAKILASASGIKVLGVTGKPLEVTNLIEQLKPDVVTLDIYMPDMDGVSLLKEIFPKYKIPTVMISSIREEEGPMIFNALEAGAVDYIEKPRMEDLDVMSQGLIERIRMAATAQVANPKVQSRNRHKIQSVQNADSVLVAIGASTGGTEALRDVLTQLPNEIPPIVIVQHIPAAFSKALADRLNTLCPFRVKEAEDGELILPNNVYIAPGGRQMSVLENSGRRIIRIDDSPMVNRHRPSVDYLFFSIARNIRSPVVGVILTGMGADGAKGMLQLKHSGAKTIAQDSSSCVVFGMPREAIQLGGANHIVHLNDIPLKIMDLVAQFKRQD